MEYETYGSVSQNLIWEYSKSTGDTRNTRDMYTLSELYDKRSRAQERINNYQGSAEELDRLHLRLSNIERPIRVTEARNSQ